MFQIIKVKKTTLEVKNIKKSNKDVLWLISIFKAFIKEGGI